MLVDLLQLVGGLALLLAAGFALVQGAGSLARSLGVSPLVIGLTVVAFGTSAPELAVNVTAAIRDQGDVAFGNLMGSNLANVGLVLGTAAVVRPLVIQGVLITREIPMMLLASFSVLVMGLDHLRGEPESRFDRSEGLLLLLLFCVFLYYTVRAALGGHAADPLVEQVAGRRLPSFESALRHALLMGGGFLGLIIGGQLTVAGAVATAEALAVPESVVALVVIAVGTSLPELSTSVIAAWRGETDLAVGNVVGSNIFNLLFVLGVTATIRPVPVPVAGSMDLIAMVVMAALLFVVCSVYGGRRISHAEGWLLLACYAGYVAARVE